MFCCCANLPEVLKVDDEAQFTRLFEEMDRSNWMRLFRCKDCRQHWIVDRWDKLQLQLAFKTNGLEGWKEANLDGLRRRHLLDDRGGLTDEKCIWKDCAGKRIRGSVYCLDHLYQTGARE